MYGGGGIWGSFVGSDDHLTREREPPPRPISLEFPQYVPPFQPQPLTNKLSSRLRHKICHMRSLSEIQDVDLASFNIHFEPDVPLSSVIPTDQFQSRPFLYDDDLQAMLDEIGVDNRDAFREVLRMPPLENRKKPRLAYARNFFGSLEDMARYFDASHDNYYMVRADQPKKPEAQNPGEEAETNSEDSEMKDAAESHISTMKEVYKGYRISNAESMSSGTRVAMTRNLLKMVMHKFQCRDHEPMPQPREKLTFRGVRIQSIQYHFCVARIPREIKQARLRLVEGPLIAVHAREELRFKVKEGLFFPERTGFAGEKFDLFREVGCMLIIAVQRARAEREAATDKSESSQWWVTRQRWGGGPTRWGQLACDVFEDEDPSWSPEEKKLQEEKRRREEEEKEREKETMANAQSLDVDQLLANPQKEILPGLTQFAPQPKRKKFRGPEPSPEKQPVMRDGRRVMHLPPMRRKWYQDWQVLRPNTPMRDDKIISRKIGAEDQAESGFDEVYMLSSCNHHVSISKMRVHAAYLDWLEGGKRVDDSGEMKNRKDVLFVVRSQWYDMFDVEARKEFLTALWQLMSWINRNEVPKEELEKMEDKKRRMSVQMTESSISAGLTRN